MTLGINFFFHRNVLLINFSQTICFFCHFMFPQSGNFGNSIGEFFELGILLIKTNQSGDSFKFLENVLHLDEFLTISFKEILNLILRIPTKIKLDLRWIINL